MHPFYPSHQLIRLSFSAFIPFAPYLQLPPFIQVTLPLFLIFSGFVSVLPFVGDGAVPPQLMFFFPLPSEEFVYKRLSLLLIWRPIVLFFPHRDTLVA